MAAVTGNTQPRAWLCSAESWQEASSNRMFQCNSRKDACVTAHSLASTHVMPYHCMGCCQSSSRELHCWPRSGWRPRLAGWRSLTRSGHGMASLAVLHLRAWFPPWRVRLLAIRPLCIRCCFRQILAGQACNLDRAAMGLLARLHTYACAGHVDCARQLWPGSSRRRTHRANKPCIVQEPVRAGQWSGNVRYVVNIKVGASVLQLQQALGQRTTYGSVVQR